MTVWRNVYRYSHGDIHLGVSEYADRDEAQGASRRFLGDGTRTLYRIKVTLKVPA
jgi:hypothetical protein